MLGDSFKIGSHVDHYGSLLCLGLFALAWFVLSQTTWGRRIFALGDAPEATRLMGINVKRQLTMIYVVAGVIYGFAALLLVSRTGVGDPNAGQTENLEGDHRGRARRHLAVRRPRHHHRHADRRADRRRARNGLVLMGVASIYQVLITGILVILAVSVDQLARRRAT